MARPAQTVFGAERNGVVEGFMSVDNTSKVPLKIERKADGDLLHVGVGCSFKLGNARAPLSADSTSREDATPLRQVLSRAFII